MTADDLDVTKSLRENLDRFDIVLPEETILKLSQYAQMLWKANEQINLTRHTDMKTFVIRDVVDTLQLSSVIPDDQVVLDIGSGGGVPGLLLAIERPDLRIELCEATGKKAKVLSEFVEQLGLPVVVHSQRVQDLLTKRSYKWGVARAVGSLSQLLKILDSRWHALGKLLAIKGPRWTDERAEARHKGLMKGIHLRIVGQYTTPITEAKNVILALWHDQDQDDAEQH